MTLPLRLTLATLSDLLRALHVKSASEACSAAAWRLR